MKPYTVVGVWEDNSDVYIEDVEAETVVDAIVESCKINCRDPEQVVAVFEGHPRDLFTEEHREAVLARRTEWEQQDDEPQTMAQANAIDQRDLGI